MTLIRHQYVDQWKGRHFRGAWFLLAFAQLCHYPLWDEVAMPIFADGSVTNRCESKSRADNSVRTLPFSSSVSNNPVSFNVYYATEKKCKLQIFP